MPKALVLFSGGLDSMLAVKVLQTQGIEVDGVCFVSNFFGSEKAEKAADSINLNLKIIDIGSEILEIVKNPPSGYGKNLNPCIDCHAFMIKKADEIMKAEKYDFIATGEVLGQRPFSQTEDALKRVERLSDVEVLRPLSAKLLAETKIEKDGLVNRGRLLNISGRSRDRQVELVEKYDLKNYATPAGGCLLTDPEFAQRLMKMMDYWLDFNHTDVELLKNGRVFWFNSEIAKKVLVVIGRKHEENEKLKKLAQEKDILLEIEKIMGPTALIRFKSSEFKVDDKQNKIFIPKELKMSELHMDADKDEKEILNIAAILTGYYSTKARGKEVKIKIK